MGMNIGALMKIKQAWDMFSSNHPKFALFLQAIGKKGVPEGAIIEIAITYPDGQKLESSLRVQQSDLELIEIVKSLGGQN